MDRIISSRMAKRSAVFIVIIYLFFAIFGASVLLMPMDADGHMSGCEFMGMPALCQMTLFEHMSAWQSMFIAAISEHGIISLMLIIFAFACLCLSIYGIPIYRETPLILRPRRADPYMSRDPLQQAFSDGILNAKVF